MTRFFTRVAAAWGPREGFAWLATSLIVVLFLIEFSQPIVQADDAFISYRYALNLAHGNGLVFNPGEYVEGFTNLLWTVLIAGFIRLGVHAPAAGQLLSVVFAALSLALLHVYVRRFLPVRWAWMAAGAPVAMLAANSFACWMSACLETPMVLFLTIAALLAFDRERKIATAWLCVLALLCRPEGGILAVVLLGVPWIMAVLRGPRTPRDILRLSAPPLIFVAALAALTAFRLYYYGDYVPNTFHAKVGQAATGLGWLYIEKFLADGSLFLLPGIAFSVWAVPRLRVPLLFVLATAAYCVAVGGDVFSYGRFLLPTLPVLLAATIGSAAWLMARSLAAGWMLATAIPAFCIVSLYVVIPLPYGGMFAENLGLAARPFPLSAKRREAKRHYFTAQDERRVVRLLAAKIRATKPGATLIACIGIGKIAYYNMDFRILDLVGLTDRHIAESQRSIPGTFVVPGHSRTDADYVLSRAPDVIIIPGKDALRPGRLPAETDLLSNPRLEQDYVYHPEGGFWVRK